MLIAGNATITLIVLALIYRPLVIECVDPGYAPGDLVVDLGAGDGALTAALVDAGARVVAIELHPARVALLRERFADDPVTVVGADITTVRLPRRPFRVVANPPWVAGRDGPGVAAARHRRWCAADLVLPRWLVRRWADVTGRIDVGCSLRAESFRPAAPTGATVAVAPRPPRRRYGTVPPERAVDPPRLFAYGTLQPGRLRWPFLAPFAVGHRPADVARAVPRHRLRLARRRVRRAGDGWCPGTLIDLDPARLDEALDVLDDVEATATDLLAAHRRHDDRPATAAWAYHCDRPTPAWSASPRGTARRAMTRIVRPTCAVSRGSR